MFHFLQSHIHPVCISEPYFFHLCSFVFSVSSVHFLHLMEFSSLMRRLTRKGPRLNISGVGYRLQNPNEQWSQPSERTGDTGKTETCAEGCSAKPKVGTVATLVKIEAYTKTSWVQLEACNDAPLPPDFNRDVVIMPPPADFTENIQMPVLVSWVILPGCPVSTSWLHK